MINERAFCEMASRVEGAYPDFVAGVYLEAREERLVDEVYRFMSANNGISTDDVAEYLSRLEGYPRPYAIASAPILRTA